jgi:Ca-activated chloride channel family protein
MKTALFAALLSCCFVLAGLAAGEPQKPDPQAELEKDVTQGALRVVQKDGSVVECPLKHTDVQAEISGFIARVKVTQTFFNPLDEKIEAVYVFPLPHESAVDEMTMVMGERRIIGQIKRRAEARAIYERALMAGQTAALLEQERPNIFTQSVANIQPKQEVKIEIAYVDVLKYDQGSYEFHFPMVVGPRYNPAGFSGGIGAAPRGEEGGSGQRVEVAYLKPGERNGHDISLAVKLDAGVPIQNIKSVQHPAEIKQEGNARATAALAQAGTIPNKDFILKYNVLGKKPEMAVLSYTESTMGYFMLMIQPKEDERLAQQPPREIVFLIDVSGSMSGAPTEKNKEAMKEFLSLMREKDTVQVMTFASNAQKLFEKPLPVTKENIARALNFTENIKGGGGTEMLKGVRMAIEEPIDKERMRVVIMLTDGYIGNEAQIIEAVGKSCGDQIRFWCLGIGSSVNRFLVDGVAKQGGGMGKVVALNEPAAPTVRECMERIQRAQLSKIRIDWGGVTVSDVHPARLPELWAGRPVIVYGLYDLGTSGKPVTLTISGDIEGQPAAWPLEVTFPIVARDHMALSKVWARQKIESLMQQTYYAGSPEVEEEVTNIALDYALMSQYTSFVAVDSSQPEVLGSEARPPRRVGVPVPMPEGVSFEGVFGCEDLRKDVAGLKMEVESLRRSVSNATVSNRKVDALVSANYGPAAPLRQGGWGGAPAEAQGRFRAVGGRAGEKAKELGYAFKSQPMFDRRAAAYLPAATAAPAPVMAGKPGRALALAEAPALTADWDGNAPYQWQQAMQSQANETQKQSATVVTAAEELRKAGKLLEARARFAHAYLLDTALVNAGYSGGDKAAAALQQIEEINAELLKAWRKALPALDKKLDLVLRDKPFGEALAAVAQAAGLKARLTDGSLDDACALAGKKELRVSYLDLRNARTAQALDWLLTPNGLRWQVAGDTVVCGADRRNADVETAWVYDVALIALPGADETKEQDYQKQVEALRKAHEQFAKAVRKALGLQDAAIAWYGPGQVLLCGTAEKHTAAAKLFVELAHPKATVNDELKDLHKLTSARAEKRKEAAAKAPAEREKADVWLKLEQFGWPALAGAAAGKLDDEALTEMAAAWKSAHMAELAKGPGTAAVLRSFWAHREAARIRKDWNAAWDLGGESLARAAAETALAALEKNPDDVSAWYATLYAALAFRSDVELFAKARAALNKAGATQSPLNTPRTLAAALLAPAKDIDAKAVAEALRNRNEVPAEQRHGYAFERLQGEDAVVLASLTCRRAGAEAWHTFRVEQSGLLGNQPLHGSVVVLVNRIERASLGVLEK